MWPLVKTASSSGTSKVTWYKAPACQQLLIPYTQSSHSPPPGRTLLLPQPYSKLPLQNLSFQMINATSICIRQVSLSLKRRDFTVKCVLELWFTLSSLISTNHLHCTSSNINDLRINALTTTSNKYYFTYYANTLYM